MGLLLCAVKITSHLNLLFHGLAREITRFAPNVITRVKLLLHGHCFALYQIVWVHKQTKTF